MRRKRIAIFASFLILGAAMGGCVSAPSPQPTPEQLALQKALLARLTGAAAPQAVAPNPDPTPALSEDELASKLARLPERTGEVTFKKRRDGFDVNGRPYVDPEGQIIRYGFDTTSADVTYIVAKPGGDYAIKYFRAVNGTSPILIATASRQGMDWEVRTVTGKTVAGQRLTPLSRGFMVSRDTSGFIYEPGKGLRTFSTPEGFHVASFQNGDIQGTGLVLLERDPVDESNPIGGLADRFKSLGAAVGINKKEDYQLMDIATGEAYALNVDMNGKEVHVYKDCYRTGKIAPGVYKAQCAQAETFDSIFEPNGLPNTRHYYWRIAWFNTKLGPLALVNETTKVKAYALKKNLEGEIFSRALGVNWFVAEQKSDGRIEVEARLGFSTDRVSDAVEALLRSSSASAKAQ